MSLPPLWWPTTITGVALVARDARHDGVVVGEAAVAVDLDELGEEQLDVLEDARPRRVPRHQHPLPRRQVSGTARRGSTRRARRRLLDLRLARRRRRQHRERLDLLQQDADRFFEFEQFRHGWDPGSGIGHVRRVTDDE